MATSDVIELLAFDLAEPDHPERDPWWRVTTGELSIDGVVAERRGVEEADDEQLRQRARLYAPPSPEEHARVRDELLARFFAEGEGAGGAGAGAGAGPGRGDGSVGGDGAGDSEEGSAEGEGRGAAATDGGGAEEIAASVVDLGAARRWRRRVAVGVLAVAAATVLAWSLRPRDSEPGEPMPGFAPEWSNQYTGTMRSVGVSEGCERYKSDGRLRVQLRPAVTVAEDLFVAALARPEGGDDRRLAIEPTLSAAGVITIDQPVDALGLGPGEWTLTFFVSRGAQLSEGELSALSPAEHPEVAVTHSTICIED